MTAPTTREETLDRWSQLHGGVDAEASRWIAGWVVLSHACARPLAHLRVSPNVVTWSAVVVMAAAPGIAALGRWWPIVAAAVVTIGAVLDGVDGALAIQTDSVSRWGRVIDPLADRCSDVLLIGVLVVLGMPLWLGIALALITVLLESVRATAQAAGMDGPGHITLWERPSRVLVAVFGSLSVGVVWCLRHWGVDAAAFVTGPLLVTSIGVVGSVLAIIGMAQLLVAIRHQLRPAATPAGDAHRSPGSMPTP